MSNDLPLIFSYTRAQALADGVLMSLPLTQHFAFRVPVAITSAGHASVIAWDEHDPKVSHIVSMHDAVVLQAAVREAKMLTRRQNGGEHIERPGRIDFTVECVASDGTGRLVAVALYMLIGPCDDADPVGTIMLQNED